MKKKQSPVEIGSRLTLIVGNTHAECDVLVDGKRLEGVKKFSIQATAYCSPRVEVVFSRIGSEPAYLEGRFLDEKTYQEWEAWKRLNPGPEAEPVAPSAS